MREWGEEEEGGKWGGVRGLEFRQDLSGTNCSDCWGGGGGGGGGVWGGVGGGVDAFYTVWVGVFVCFCVCACLWREREGLGWYDRLDVDSVVCKTAVTHIFVCRFMTDYEAWNELCDLYLSLHDYANAAFCIEELIMSNPHNHLYHQKYADVSA